VDYSSGEITTEEAAELIKSVAEHLNTELLEFHAGISYRHDVDLVAFLEQVGQDDVTYVVLAAILNSELLQILLGGYASLCEMALHGLCQLLVADVSVAELDGSVAVLLNSLHLCDCAGASFDYSYGNHLTGCIEDLCHADLLTDDCSLQLQCYFLLKLVVGKQ
ncbi:MAG: hypothetical protein IJO16_03400, partial [Clostridia bacterium]|nr:hypothetical protein [Clostridia bacterium]